MQLALDWATGQIAEREQLLCGYVRGTVERATEIWFTRKLCW